MGLDSGGCRPLLLRRFPSNAGISRDVLTSHITRVYSDGLDLDQHFVLAWFWRGDFFENDLFTLGLFRGEAGPAHGVSMDLFNECIAGSSDVWG